MLTAAQKKTRATGIGSSEIASIVGVSPFGDATKVWLRKTGRLPEQPATKATEAGHYLEDAVARWAADRNGWLIRKVGRALRGPEPWIVASPDRWLLNGEERRVGIIEVKTARDPDWIDPEKWGSFGADGTDEIPKSYRCQAQWQMVATGLHVVHLPVFFFATRELRVYRVEHSESLATTLVDAGRRFWTEHVVADCMPELAEIGESTDAALAALLKDASGKIVAAPPEAARWAAELRQANRDMADAEERKERATNYLKAYVGSDKGIESYWGRFTWGEAAGRVDYRAAFENLAAAVKLPPETAAKLAEGYRAPSARRVNFRWKDDE